MYATYHRFFRTGVWRILLGLVLPLTFLPWSLGGPLPVHAASKTPKHRIQVIVKSAHIYDDRDWHSQGDIEMDAHLYRCPANLNMPCVPGETGVTPLTYHTHRFDGWSSKTTRLDRTLPHATDSAWGYDLSEDAGYPMYDGERYVLRFQMWDRDNLHEGYGDDWDYMGWVDIWLDEETGYQLRAHQQDAAKGGGKRGDYRLEYEVMRTPLPNLVPYSIERFDVPESTESLVCVGVVNSGVAPSDSFPVTLHVDGGNVRNGEMNGGALAPGQFEQVCTQTQLPNSGGYHSWAAIVDRAELVPEMKESDNDFRETVVLPSGTGPAPGTSPAPSGSPTPTPTPMPGQAQADLTLNAITVNGQAPDGKDDCQNGKNRVAVVVKNGGAAKSGAFAVRLAADGEQVAERSVNGLEAGQEREVRFDDVRLKKGEHALTAIADPAKAIAESNEDNNELKVTAACKGDS